MDKLQAVKIIKEVFENPFDKTRVTNFVKNLLNHVEVAPFSHRGNLIPDAFSEYVSVFERIGKYSSGDSKIDILVVHLKRETSIERARTMQRNFIARYLNGSRGGELKDAALVAFVSPSTEDWRFSLVKMDYRFEEGKNGKVKVKEEFTPARRWSFLVGKNENSHTAQSRLVSILADDRNNPTLAEIEEAFNIEKVTREFFTQYRNLFIRTKEELEDIVKKDTRLKEDFDSKGVNTVDFSKKLLGQIVFLYFLQKKGWFGVGRNAEWGSGSKHFLRELFEKKHSQYKNFFNDILEPLFYDALRNDRSHDDHYYSRFDCKIPFLNGGLFDPIGNYDWVKTEIKLPDELFSNTQKTREGDIGNGILDVFDRYNFTVREDEPLEKEVAIDPELLGKAYEKFNAIRPDNFNEYLKALKSGTKGEESKFNKQYGVYYTPREIVHYMCQQSLINYLYTELNRDPASYEKLGDSQLKAFGNEDKTGQLELTIEHKTAPEISKKDIEILIQAGEHISENEAIYLEKERKIKNGEQKTTGIKSLLPDSIKENAELIDEKLAQIKVCDPAIGSGAFPVGMMSEIVKARNALTPFIKNQARTPYHFKRNCIEHSLYGVDIDSGAVEIAKLRLWLSLVVDEDDIKNIKPLPNLDYKIVCGNSLLGVEKNLFNEPLFADLEKLKPLFFNETNPTKKQECKKQIDKLISEITSGLKEFDFEVYFSEVFHEKGGFDVVIANPPYVSSGKIGNIKKILERYYIGFYCGTADLYTYFIKKGLDLLCVNGCLCYITSNKYMRAGYGKNTRELLINKATPAMLIDFGELPVFEAATDPSIILALKNNKPDHVLIAIAIKSEEEICSISKVVKKRAFNMPVRALSPQGWILENDDVLRLKEKLKHAGTTLGERIKGRIYYGIKTGFNKAFIIDEETKRHLISDDKKSKDLIKPWLDGNEILKWTYLWSNQYIIKIESSANFKWPWSAAKNERDAILIFQSQYPAIYAHLVEYKENLKSREDQGTFWWELRSCAYYDAFQQTKLLYNETSKELHAFIDHKGFYINKTGFIIISDNNEYLLGLLNSKLLDWYYRVDFPTYGDPWKGGRIQFRKDPNMLAVPIASATTAQKSNLIDRVQKILSLTQSPDYPQNPTAQATVKEYEKQIDRMVYELYGLSEEEIKIVEGKK